MIVVFLECSSFLIAESSPNVPYPYQVVQQNYAKPLFYSVQRQLPTHFTKNSSQPFNAWKRSCQSINLWDPEKVTAKDRVRKRSGKQWLFTLHRFSNFTSANSSQFRSFFFTTGGADFTAGQGRNFGQPVLMSCSFSAAIGNFSECVST